MIASEINQLYESFTRKVLEHDDFERERLWITYIKPLCETTMSVRDVELVIVEIATRAIRVDGSCSVLDVLESMEAQGKLQVQQVDYKILELMAEVQELQKAPSGLTDLKKMDRMEKQIKRQQDLLKEGMQQWTVLDQKRREMERFMMEAQRVFADVAGTHVVKAEGRLVGTVGGVKQVFEVDEKETILHLKIQ